MGMQNALNILEFLENNCESKYQLDLNELSDLAMFSEVIYKRIKIILISTILLVFIDIIKSEDNINEITKLLKSDSNFKKCSIIIRFLAIKVFDKLNNDTNFNSDLRDLINNKFPSKETRDKFYETVSSISNLSNDIIITRLCGLIINSKED